jgi:hypothetical protein
MIHQIVDLLNEAYEADPAAVHALLCNRVPCNLELAEHPTIVVEENTIAAGHSYTVGMLGVINGIATKLTGQSVASMWADKDDPEYPKLLGFKIYTPAVANPASE